MAVNENFQAFSTAEGGSDRQFGVVFAVVCGFLGSWPMLRHGLPFRIWALVLAGVFLLLALAAPGLLKPINRLWMRVGVLLQRIINPIIMALLFYTAFVPIGLLMRAFGRDSLALAKSTGSGTYWIKREPHSPPPSSMTAQF